jgi:hypothetical protein
MIAVTEKFSKIQAGVYTKKEYENRGRVDDAFCRRRKLWK